MDDESRLSNAAASLSMGGLEVTGSDKELARRCMRHEISYDDAVRQLAEEYSKRVKVCDTKCGTAEGISADQLEWIRSSVGAVASKYPVQSVYLFGSRARGDNTDDSDYDFMVVPKEHMTAFQMCGMLSDLEELFGDVDLISSRSISGEFEQNVKNDMMLVYSE